MFPLSVVKIETKVSWFAAIFRNICYCHIIQQFLYGDILCVYVCVRACMRICVCVCTSSPFLIQYLGIRNIFFFLLHVTNKLSFDILIEITVLCSFHVFLQHCIKFDFCYNLISVMARKCGVYFPGNLNVI
jgi:hypothetical protein